MALGFSSRRGQRIWAALLGGLALALFAAIPLTRRIARPETPLDLFERAVTIPAEETVRPPVLPHDQPILFSGTFHIQRFPPDETGQGRTAYVFLRREVEQYVYEERKIPEERLPPGTKDPTLMYDYELTWQTDPIPWRNLHVWKGHEYKKSLILDQEWIAQNVTFGRLTLDLAQATLFGKSDVPLTGPSDQLDRAIHDERFVYEDETARSAPVPGSFRARYIGIPVDREEGNLIQASVLGWRQYNEIVPFLDRENRSHLYFSPGDPARLKAALAALPRHPVPIPAWGYGMAGLGALLLLLTGLLAFLSRTPSAPPTADLLQPDRIPSE